MKNLILSAITTTENAAIACKKWIGKKNQHEADKAAVDAMRKSLNMIDFNGRVVIGEGERDQAPMLYIGEAVGTKNGLDIDIALDPLEGTKLCAYNEPNSLAVLAFAKKGSFLYAPDIYMDKIVIGKDLPNNIIDLDNTPQQNLKNLAQAKNCSISDLKVIILDRLRHKDLIAYSKEAGARVTLIGDGDIAAAISTSFGTNKADIYMGIGGAPEGVIAAAALSCIGGQMLGKLIFDNESQKERATKMGIRDFNKKYQLNELAHGDIIFCATGVTSGDFVEGVQLKDDKIITQTLLIHSMDNSISKITKFHNK